MPIQGNKEVVGLLDKYFILDDVVGSQGGATGVGPEDDLEAVVSPGDSLVLNGVEYVVKAVGATGITLTSEHGSTGPIAGATGYVSQKPKILTLSQRSSVFGVDATEMGATSVGAAHAGWVKIKHQTGYVYSVALNTTGASGYDPESLPPVSFSAGGASGVAVVSEDGVLTSVAVTNPGSYTGTAPTVTIGSTGATGVVGTVVMGGRFGRTTFETLSVIANNAKADMGDAENTEFTV